MGNIGEEWVRRQLHRGGWTWPLCSVGAWGPASRQGRGPYALWRPPQPSPGASPLTRLRRVGGPLAPPSARARTRSPQRSPLGGLTLSNDQNAEENQEATDVVKTLTPGENQTAPAAGPLQTPFPVSESGLGAATRGPGLAASLFAESTELQDLETQVHPWQTPEQVSGHSVETTVGRILPSHSSPFSRERQNRVQMFCL